MDTQTYTIPQAAKLTGINYPCLDRWIRHDKLLGDSAAKGHGRGIPRTLTWTDLVFLRCVKRLTDRGVSYRSIKKTVREARTSFGMPDGAPVALVASGDTVCVTRSNDEIIDILRGGQLVMALTFADEAVVELQQRNGTEIAAEPEADAYHG
ncbi:MAG: MerR family transcriptional regulator [Actinobacteria bacterium]|jgi:DNA-binding transcriptional MerR regulator|nr:MerR family transcriptional regulator [Actinomycetota bacterium]